MKYFSLRSKTFYPNAAIEGPGKMGVPPIPDKFTCATYFKPPGWIIYIFKYPESILSYQVLFVFMISFWSIKRWLGGIGLFRFAEASSPARSPNSFSISNFREYCTLWVLLYFIFNFDDYPIWRNLFFSKFNLDNSARPGIPTCVQKTDPTPAAEKRPLVQACRCSLSLHTHLNLVILHIVPRDAALNSSSQPRAMLECVARKKKPKTRFNK